jgi:glycosyltransferase involved in cell wall biosynthesis
MLLISSLEHGGAERQVVELANRLGDDGFRVLVCALEDCNPLADQLVRRDSDFRVVAKRGRYDPSVVWRVARLMRQERIEVVHAFLFDAEMVARLAARLAGVPVVIASERNIDMRVGWVQWLGKRLTRSWFDVLIANSETGGRFNTRMYGIAPTRIRVIRNGVDVERFRPLDQTECRRAVGLPLGVPIVGMVAAFKRQKNYEDFLHLARRLRDRLPAVHLACVGEPLRDNLQGAADYQREVLALVDRLRLHEHIAFLGRRDDMPSVYNSFDVTVLPSKREGTPNVLLESMACGVPVVASDISDNAHVVPDGRVGFVVPLGDVAMLTQRTFELLSDTVRRTTMGQAARRWVATEFSTAALVQRTAAIYTEALRRKLGHSD